MIKIQTPLKPVEFRSRIANKRRENALAWLFVLPALTIFVVFMFWPLVYTVYLSFFKWNMVSKKTYVGLQYYQQMLKSPVFWQLLSNTIFYVLILVAINFVLPYVLAYIYNFVMTRFKSTYKVLFFMPSLISLVVGAMIFQWLFNPLVGPVVSLLAPFGVVMPAWTKTPGLVIVIISLVACYKAFGYNFLVLLSGVNNVPDELIEAARLEKASHPNIFRRVVIPLTSSTAIYVLIMSVVQGVQYVYTPISILTQGGPSGASSNIIYSVYEQAFLIFNSGTASVLAVITMVIFVLLLYLEFRFVEQGVYYEN